ncbi:hypothetical protein BC830DRAFT_295896 [Chytriomyces sp. MP71]|nr:hypothetical protein BC830DRAFT_295896 [Chytriomyces sp. MP71]
MAAFLPKFQFSSGVRPSGEVSRLITAATNFKLPEVEWTLVFTAIERINAHPAEGSSEAVKTIKYSLEATDPVAINYTLSVLDVLLKNCVTEFSAECTTKDSRKYFHRFLERKDLAAENRGKLLEILADAGTGSTSHPEFRKFLEALIAAGFKFSDASLSKLSPAELERLKPARTTTSSVKSRVTYLDSQKETLPTYSNALNADISSVTHRERAEWVHFDCNLAAGCAGMLFDTVEDAHSSIDLTHNVVVKVRHVL